MPAKLFTKKEEKDIVQMYEKEGLSSGEIAEKLNCVGQTILVILRKHKVKIGGPTRRVPPPDQGKLVAGREFLRVEQDQIDKNGRSHEVWTLKCSCGKEITKRKTIVMLYERNGLTIWCKNKHLNHFRIKVGEKYNRLTVKRIERVRTTNKKGETVITPYAYCDCECGTKNYRLLAHAVGKKTKSCGCLIGVVNHERKDPRKGTKEWDIYYSCKKRSREKGIPFNIDFEDIVIPDTCPILGIKIEPGQGLGNLIDSSPTIDKFYPELGYVKGNIQVVSWRANRFKSDGTPEEWEKIAEWCKKEDIRKRLEGRHPDQQKE